MDLYANRLFSLEKWEWANPFFREQYSLNTIIVKIRLMIVTVIILIRSYHLLSTYYEIGKNHFSQNGSYDNLKHMGTMPSLSFCFLFYLTVCSHVSPGYVSSRTLREILRSLPSHFLFSTLSGGALMKGVWSLQLSHKAWTKIVSRGQSGLSRESIQTEISSTSWLISKTFENLKQERNETQIFHFR